jgi:REP element-mobilizing transposase RayT
MPRTPRIHFPGATFHVMARGNGRQDIFLHDGDRQFFLGKLLELRDKAKFLIHAYCLMGNHFHLLLEMGDRCLSAVMQQLLTAHARKFNWRYGRSGHLFEGRHREILVSRDAYFLALVRYIHLNPVKDGFVKSPADWPWSGHNELVSGQRKFLHHDQVLAYFGASELDARAEYQQFVIDKMYEPMDETQFDEIEVQNGSFVSLSATSTLAGLGEKIAGEGCISLGELRSGTKKTKAVASRRRLIVSALHQGIRPVDIAEYLQCSPSAVSKALRLLQR